MHVEGELCENALRFYTQNNGPGVWRILTKSCATILIWQIEHYHIMQLSWFETGILGDCGNKKTLI